MESGLFPASVKDPNLQAKISDYDFYTTLRRLTDNVFTSEVDDQYQAFMIVTRIWRYIVTRIQLGQENNIDKHFPHRPAGTLMLYCPACPDPGINMKGKWWLTPEFLNNNQINQFWKNFDGSDFSVFDGHGHFPDAMAYLKYLELLGGTNAESG
ncbi:hypothetical protein MPER_07292, partial [Moniliophthora perniciosa FA553]